MYNYALTFVIICKYLQGINFSGFIFGRCKMGQKNTYAKWILPKTIVWCCTNTLVKTSSYSRLWAFPLLFLSHVQDSRKTWCIVNYRTLNQFRHVDYISQWFTRISLDKQRRRHYLSVKWLISFLFIQYFITKYFIFCFYNKVYKFL